jgi:hypothetical protein
MKPFGAPFRIVILMTGDDWEANPSAGTGRQSHPRCAENSMPGGNSREALQQWKILADKFASPELAGRNILTLRVQPRAC